MRSPFDILEAYEQRSLQHAVQLPGREFAAELWRGVGYRIGNRRLVSDFREVVEIVPMPQVTVVPGAQPSVMLLLAALVIDLVKRGDAQGTWQQSHFSWRIRSVIWAAIWYVLTIWGFFLGLLLFNPLWVVVSVWFLYRIVRGMIAMNKNQAIHV